MRVVQGLRETGIPWPIHYSMQPIKLGKQLQQAEELGCCLAVVIDAEIVNDQIGLKDLQTRMQKPLTLGTYQSLIGFWTEKINEIARTKRASGTEADPSTSSG